MAKREEPFTEGQLLFGQGDISSVVPYMIVIQKMPFFNSLMDTGHLALAFSWFPTFLLDELWCNILK
jgi:hypothetical protein